MKKHRKKLLYIPIMLVGLLMLLPLCLMVTNSFLGVREIQEAYGIVLEESGEEFSFRILPQYFTLRPMLLPLCLMVTNSFLGVREIQEAYGIVLEESGEEFSFRILPQYFTLRPYVELLCLMVTNSFLGVREIQEAYGIVLEESGEEFSFRILPQYFTLRPYVELLLDSPDFFVMFWNSSRQVFPILLGQIVIGMPAAWAFARFQFRGRRRLFFGYMVLMILPFQVTMVSYFSDIWY